MARMEGLGHKTLRIEEIYGPKILHIGEFLGHTTTGSLLHHLDSGSGIFQTTGLVQPYKVMAAMKAVAVR